MDWLKNIAMSARSTGSLNKDLCADGPRQCDEASRDDDVDETTLQAAQAYCERQLASVDSCDALRQKFEEFHETYTGVIRRYARCHGVPEQDLDDCVQEVWMAVHCSFREFKQLPQRRCLRSWLFVLVRNKAADYVRRLVRQPNLSIEALTGVPEPASEKDNPESVYDRQFTRQLILTVIERLAEQGPKTEVEIFRLRFLDEQRPRAIAAKFGLKADDVYQVLRRMRLRFRSHFRLYVEFDFAFDP